MKPNNYLKHWRVRMVCVHGVCAWCVCMVCVHGVCAWCVRMVCVHVFSRVHLRVVWFIWNEPPLNRGTAAIYPFCVFHMRKF